MRDLTDRTAVVTGAASGIGAGIASVLASEGARLVLVDADGDRLRVTADRLDGEHLQLVTDLTEPDAARRIAGAALSSTGRIDILASNAGIYPVALIDDLTDDDWERVMGVNATAGFRLIRACAPAMRRQGFGRIVLTSSITGSITAMPGLVHYAASKAAVLGLVRGAAVELAGSGITVNAVLPGTVDTEGLRRAGGDAFVELMAPAIPAGRLGTALDLGWAVRLLAAEEASYITGAALVVDGGQTLTENAGATADVVDVVVP